MTVRDLPTYMPSDERREALAEARAKCYAYALDYEDAKRGVIGANHGSGELAIMWAAVANAMKIEAATGTGHEY